MRTIAGADEPPSGAGTGTPVGPRRTGRRHMWLKVVAVALAVTAGLVMLNLPESDPATLPFDEGTPAAAADDFVNSIGVNTHLRYSDTSYDEFDMVQRRLLELGVRHIRDDLTVGTPAVYDRFNELADAGIKTTFLMGRPEHGGEGSPYGTLEDLFEILRTEALSAAEAVEGPNEPDLSAVPRWAEETQEYQERLFDMIAEDEATRDLPVLAPSIGRWRDRDRYTRLGELTASADHGNLHVYSGGVMMSGESLRTAIDNGRIVSGDLPLQVTETGYHQSPSATDQPEGHPAVTPEVGGVLIPRILLEGFRVGIDRTFLYEFLDQRDEPAVAESNFGLLTYDFEPKPAFTSIQNLIRILDDPGPSIRPGALEYEFEGGGSDLRTLLLQKRDGRFYLALWQQVEVEDGVDCGRDDSAPGNVVLRVNQPIESVRIFRPSCSSAPLLSEPFDGGVVVSTSPDVVLVELTPDV